MPGQCTRSRAEGDGRSAANQCCDMKADLATIGPEATLKARRCVGPTRATRLSAAMIRSAGGTISSSEAWIKLAMTRVMVRRLVRK